ncbi:MAG: short-chain dehydrogenase [Ignavibacteria bacterium]|nr:short-chain dehydrogenase [Ignavibacteria bacterium]
MDIKNKRILIFGGWGLVGSAVAKRIYECEPKQIMLTSLFKDEAVQICKDLNKEFGTKNLFVPWWGNLFVRYDYKDMPREQYMNNTAGRRNIIHDIVDELNEQILMKSSIYHLLREFRPDIIIDCINTATAIAYQNIYKSSQDVIKCLESKNNDYDKLCETSEKLICSLYIPQLIRHVQILYNSMLIFKTGFYFKVGTSGTGGMGLNIPFTHSEEKPSRVLLSKSSVAGAQTLLLFLMARTPNGPMVKVAKPTASIAWKKIGYGEIKRKGKKIKIYDSDIKDTVRLGNVFKRNIDKKFKEIGNYKTVYIDTGENGIFSTGEFETISTVGQMEFITPEEIAEDVIREILGGNTGRDVVSALDGAVMDPTYRAGYLQQHAARKLEELEKKYKTSSVAFEMLGPPRLSKLLYEVYMIKLLYGNFDKFIKAKPSEISRKIFGYLAKNNKLRNEIVSLGLPVLLPNGKEVLRGPSVIIPSENEGDIINSSRKKIEKWTYDGWLDLRTNNWKIWQNRFKVIRKQSEIFTEPDHSSRYLFNNYYWSNFKEINIGKVVGWIFIHEEKGLRMKG